MKRPIIITTFLAINFLFIILHLHKQSSLIELSYAKSRKELEKEALLKQKQDLTHHMYTLHDPTAIKKFALEKGMKPLNLTQVKRL